MKSSFPSSAYGMGDEWQSPDLEPRAKAMFRPPYPGKEHHPSKLNSRSMLEFSGAMPVCTTFPHCACDGIHAPNGPVTGGGGDTLYVDGSNGSTEAVFTNSSFISYQWRNAIAAIPGATIPSYAPVSGDSGTSIFCRVNAHAIGGLTQAVDSNAIVIS